MADDGKVYIHPGEQYLHINNLEGCTSEKLNKPNCNCYVLLVKFIWMIRHEFDRSDAIMEYAADIKMHSQSDNELGQKEFEWSNTFNKIKVLIILELAKDAPNETALENEDEGASMQESSLSLLSDLVLSSVWLVHAEQGEHHEVLAEHHSIFLFCEHSVDSLFD